jgi:putative transposase
MLQIARNLTDLEEGFLRSKRYLLINRDAKFSHDFRQQLELAGPKCLRRPPRSPNLNPHIERFFRSLKAEGPPLRADCLDRRIFFGEESLRTSLREYLSHYHKERNHQGLDNKLIEPDAEVGRTTGQAQCRERLGSILRYYYREAA